MMDTDDTAHQTRLRHVGLCRVGRGSVRVVDIDIDRLASLNIDRRLFLHSPLTTSDEHLARL